MVSATGTEFCNFCSLNLKGRPHGLSLSHQDMILRFWWKIRIDCRPYLVKIIQVVCVTILWMRIDCSWKMDSSSLSSSTQVSSQQNLIHLCPKCCTFASSRSMATYPILYTKTVQTTTANFVSTVHSKKCTVVLEFRWLPISHQQCPLVPSWA